MSLYKGPVSQSAAADQDDADQPTEDDFNPDDTDADTDDDLDVDDGSHRR